MPLHHKIDGGTENIQSAPRLKARLQVDERTRRPRPETGMAVLQFKVDVLPEIPAQA